MSTAAATVKKVVLPVDKSGNSKGLKIVLGSLLTVIILAGIGFAIWYFAIRKTKDKNGENQCTIGADCKDKTKPNCIDKKCASAPSDVCSPTCSAVDRTPYCVGNTCVQCRDDDDCKSSSSSANASSSSSSSSSLKCSSGKCILPIIPSPSPPDNGSDAEYTPTVVIPRTAVTPETPGFIIQYKDKLLKCVGKTPVYVLTNAKRHWITPTATLDVLKSAHDQFGDIIELPATSCNLLLSVPIGPNI